MVIKGKLDIDEYGCLLCGESYIIETLNDNFKKGEKVFIRYFISDKEISEEEANSAFIIKSIGGDIEELDFVLDAYSEYTILDYNEELQIGGHNLFSELQDYDGKYLILIIDKINDLK